MLQSININTSLANQLGGHTVKKDVPADAVFTDTNTWRPVQNNLTSTSTSDCLSAYQGKVLNDALSRIKTVELLVDTYPSTANTFQTKSLNSGKKFSDYVYLLFIFMQYNNHFATALEPTAVFKSQTGSGNRLILYSGGASNQITVLYYVSDTSFAINQALAGDGVWHTRIYGVLKV